MVKNNTLYSFDYLSEIPDFICERGWPDLICILKEGDMIFIENSVFGVIDKCILYNKEMFETTILSKLKCGSVLICDLDGKSDLEIWQRYGFTVERNSNFGKNNLDYIKKIKSSKKHSISDFEIYAFLELPNDLPPLIKGEFVTFELFNDTLFVSHVLHNNFYEFRKVSSSEISEFESLRGRKFPIVMSSIGKRLSGQKYQTLVVKIDSQYRNLLG